MAGRPRSMMESAYAHIKQQIMVLDLEPGMPIDDIGVSKQLGISRTPVREALFRLASEGLILTDKGKSGFFVRPLDLVGISSLFEAHMVIARAIARLVAVNATPDDIAALRTAERDVAAAIERRDPEAVAARNAELHRLEATASRNSFLTSLALSIHDHGQRLGFLAFGGLTTWSLLEEHFTHVTTDHHRIIDAYEAGDPDLAEELSAAHVARFRQRILDFLSRDAAQPISLGGNILPAMRVSEADLEASRSLREPAPGLPADAPQG